MIRSFRARGVGALLAAVLLAGSCSGDDDGADRGGSADTGTVLVGLADGVIIPAFEELLGATEALSTHVDALCATPSAAVLSDARVAWMQVQQRWGRTRSVLIGPATEHRLMGRFAYRARPDDVEELAAGTQPFDVAALATMGTAVRGIYAIEVLLFAPPSETLATAEGGRRCDYIAAALDLSGQAVAATLGEWTEEDGYRSTFVEGPDGDPQMSVSTLVNDASFRLQEIDDLGLHDLVGATTADDLNSARRDGPSGTRVAYLASVLVGLVDVLTGADGQNLRALLDARSSETADRLTELASDAVDKMVALPTSITQAVADQAAVASAADAVAELKVLVGTEMASQLGVTIGFSDADGDS